MAMHLVQVNKPMPYEAGGIDNGPRLDVPRAANGVDDLGGKHPAFVTRPKTLAAADAKRRAFGGYVLCALDCDNAQLY